MASPIYVEIPIYGRHYIEAAIKYTIPSLRAALEHREVDSEVQFFIHTMARKLIKQAIGPDYKVQFLANRQQLWDAHSDALQYAPENSIVVLHNADIVVSKEFFRVIDETFVNKEINALAGLGIRANYGPAPPCGAPAQKLMQWAWTHRHQLTNDCIWPDGGGPPWVVFFPDASDENVVAHTWHFTPFAIRKQRRYLKVFPNIDFETLNSFNEQEVRYICNGELFYVDLCRPNRPGGNAHTSLSFESMINYAEHLGRAPHLRGGGTAPHYLRQFAKRVTILGHPTQPTPPVVGRMLDWLQSKVSDQPDGAAMFAQEHAVNIATHDHVICPPHADLALPTIAKKQFGRIKFGNCSVNVDEKTLLEQVSYNLRRGLPQVQPHQLNGEIVALVCGGPSLNQTIDDLLEAVWAGAKVVAVNGSYQWCIDHKIKPSAMVMLDAREFNARFVETPVPKCRYLLASQCHPRAFELCRDREVLIWQALSCGQIELDLVNKYYFGGRTFPVTHGTTVAIRAISLMRMLGYQQFDIFGLDSCYLGQEHHAYIQAENDMDGQVEVFLRDDDHPEVNHRFICAPWQVKQVQDFQSLVVKRGNLFRINVRGSGLIATMMRTGYELETGSTSSNKGD